VWSSLRSSEYPLNWFLNARAFRDTRSLTSAILLIRYARHTCNMCKYICKSLLIDIEASARTPPLAERSVRLSATDRGAKDQRACVFIWNVRFCKHVSAHSCRPAHMFDANGGVMNICSYVLHADAWRLLLFARDILRYKRVTWRTAFHTSTYLPVPSDWNSFEHVLVQAYGCPPRREKAAAEARKRLSGLEEAGESVRAARNNFRLFYVMARKIGSFPDIKSRLVRC